MKKKFKRRNAITLIGLVVTVIILLLLAGIAIATLGGQNGIFTKVKLAKKAQLESEMKEQLTMGLQELQVEKQGNATLDDVTQDWVNDVISTEYNAELKEDASYNGKLIVMTKNGIIGKFLIDQNLKIETMEYNTGSLEFEYTAVSRIDNRVKINIVVTDKVNGIKQIDYPEGNPLKVVSGVEKQISIDYEVELGKEYKFVIMTGDGVKTEKIIKIDEYFYSVTKTLGDGGSIDNKATKTSYNKSYEAIISTAENYIITGLTVTMGGQTVTTSEDNVVDASTGKIKIDKVTDDINIVVTTKKLEIKYTAIAVSTSNSASNTNSLEENSQEMGTTLYINIIATLEGNKCTVVLKEDNTKSVPYEVVTNGEYIFIITGTYNGKMITEEMKVIVNQYKPKGGFVKYDAGEWTKEEIEELESQNLYNLNKNSVNYNYYFTFGGFSYKGDSDNETEINNGKIITSRNQSVNPQGNRGFIIYTGWRILEAEEKDNKTIVKKIVHAGSPENFVLNGSGTEFNNRRAEYILSGGTRQTSYNTYKARDWNMYKDNNQLNLIKEVHAMTYDEAYKLTGDLTSRESVIRKTGGWYWLANAFNGYRI